MTDEKGPVEVSAAPAAPPAPAGGFFRSLGEIFTDPAKVFARIDAGLAWWKPFIIVCAFGVAIAAIMTPFRNQAIMPALQQLPPEQMERALANMKQFGAIGLIMVPIAMIVVYLIVAGIAHLAINIMSSRANFKKILSLIVFCGLIPLIEQIVTAAVIASRGTENIESMADLEMSIGPAALVPNAEGALAALLKSFSLFQIWYYIVLILGIAAIFRMPRKQAVIAVIPIWLISFVLLLVGSKVGGGMV